MKKHMLALISAGLLFACNEKKIEDSSQKNTEEPTIDTIVTPEKTNEYTLISNVTNSAPTINGDSTDSCWSNQQWYPISYTWMGKPYSNDDFEGKFKLSWNKSKLFLLVEIKDDSLIDTHQKWDDNWWNDDCVEIFIDENNGDEEHQFNYNAFAYHVALNTQDVVDLGTDSLPHLYNDHIKTAKVTNGKTTVWEFAIDIYDDSFVYGKENNNIVTLTEGKTLGFCLNYCDNDTSEERENFISSIPVEGKTDAERDLGWKEAKVFNDLILR